MQNAFSDIINKIRTPAIAIQLGSFGVKDFLADLIVSYKEAQKYELNIPEIKECELERLDRIISRIGEEVGVINRWLEELIKLRMAEHE